MKNVSLNLLPDKLAISLSLLCTLHCLALPVLVVLSPSIAALGLDNEIFHYWMLVAVLPISLFALTMGCKKHQRFQILLMGCIGLSILVLAALLGHDLFGETGEKVLTVIGSAIIAYGHVRNYRACQINRSCHCPEHQNNTL